MKRVRMYKKTPVDHSNISFEWGGGARGSVVVSAAMLHAGRSRIPDEVIGLFN
jgi:hypothetical protein